MLFTSSSSLSPEAAVLHAFPAALVTQADAAAALDELGRMAQDNAAAFEMRRQHAEVAYATAAAIVPRRRFPDFGLLGRSRAVRGTIRKRGLFLETWYRTQYAAERIGFDALGHFLTRGLTRDLAPNPLFDPAWYRDAHQLPVTGEAPFLHYLRIGASQALAPSPLFDAVAYLKAYPDLGPEADLLGHFLLRGQAERRRAVPVIFSEG